MGWLRGRSSAGEADGQRVTIRWTIILAEAARPLFPPLDRALIQSLASEVVAVTKQPLSRQSLADLTNRAKQTLGRRISRSTVWRVLHDAVIKPWPYDHWILPRDPAFAKKAARVSTCIQDVGKVNIPRVECHHRGAPPTVQGPTDVVLGVLPDGTLRGP